MTQAASACNEAAGVSKDKEAEAFEQEALRVHNEYRRKHGVPELKLNPEMCKFAREWATHLMKENKFAHRPDNKYGENLYTSRSTDPQYKVTAKDACDSWHAEIKDHQFGVEPKTIKSGHFSQKIWMNSTELGIGMAGCNGKFIIVANYNPAGNFVGQFAANCPKPK